MLIARVWRGEIPADKAEAYLAYLTKTGLRDYRRTAGNRGVLVEQHIDGDRAILILTSFWDSLDAVRRFAGDQYELARYYPEDDAFLLQREQFVLHREVVFHDLALPADSTRDA